MKLKDIKSNPNNPRIIRDAKFDKLKQSIQDFPKMLALRPIVIDAEGMVLGGNMRLLALQDLGYKEVPDEWVKRADDLTEEEQRRFIIEDNVPFGEWDWDMLANEWDGVQLEDWGLDVPGNENENENPYTKNIKAPTYEPKSEQAPPLESLVNKDKYIELLNEIEASKIDAGHKDFLKLAAVRHLVFDYEQIAEMYAHAGPDIQRLMEKSALVIIDFSAAIEYGYVELSEKLYQQFIDEYGEN